MQQFIPSLQVPNQNVAQAPSNSNSTSNMYNVSGDIVRDRISSENKEDLNLLEKLDKSEIIVVSGSADHIENVLTAIEVPHTLINPEQIVKMNFSPSQTLYINCHTGTYPKGTIEKIQTFVKTGGQLITTDWTLNNILSEAFPDTVAWNNQSTQDENVSIVCSEDDDEVLKSFKDEKSWWLAGGSHPISVLNPHKVKTLIRSQALAQKHGGDAILVRFEYGEGVVYHMISHFHLQNSATRPQHANNMSATSYAQYKGASSSTLEKMQQFKEDSAMNYAYLQSATTNTEFVMRSVVNQQKKKK